MVLNNSWRILSNGQVVPEQSPAPVFVSESESEAEQTPANPDTQESEPGRGRCRTRRSPRHARPLSHIESRSERRKRSYRFARRVANSREIAALHGIPEENSTVDDICPDTMGMFGHLLSDGASSSKWAEFSSRSEDEQRRILSGSRRTVEGTGTGCILQISPKVCFLRIHKNIRDTLRRHKHHMSSLLADWEDLLRDSFADLEDAVLVLNLESGFHRCLAHGLVQYLGLDASSIDVPKGRILLITKPYQLAGKMFPSQRLVDIL